MSDRFTIVFKGDIRAFDGNPLHIVSPFGEVVAGGIGDEFAISDALRAENARLRDALMPFTDPELKYPASDDLRAARAAMGESDE